MKVSSPAKIGEHGLDFISPVVDAEEGFGVDSFGKEGRVGFECELKGCKDDTKRFCMVLMLSDGS